MISRPDVDKLLSVRAESRSVLSMYVWVPRDKTQLRELPARADDLLAVAARSGEDTDQQARPSARDRTVARDFLQEGDRDWLGHTVGIFACSELGLAEAIPLPVELPERAVLAARPHVRPLLQAIQRLPAHRVMVADRRHAWLFSIADGKIRSADLQDGETERSRGFGGWYGLDSYNVNSRITDLARQHYQAAADLLARASRVGGPEPLVIGGHQDTIPRVLAALPEDLRGSFAGSFLIDPDTLTPAKVRDLAAGVVGKWAEASEDHLADEIRSQPPGGLAAVGLDACVAAAGQHAIRQLAVPADGLTPGFACQRCAALSTSPGGRCLDGPGAAVFVPDLLEELAVGTLTDSGQVRTLREPPGGVAALLRFEVTAP